MSLQKAESWTQIQAQAKGCGKLEAQAGAMQQKSGNNKGCQSTTSEVETRERFSLSSLGRSQPHWLRSWMSSLQKCEAVKALLRKKEQTLRFHTPWFQTILQSYSNRNSTVQKKLHKSREQSREPRNEPTLTRALNLWQRRWELTVGEDSLFSNWNEYITIRVLPIRQWKKLFKYKKLKGEYKNTRGMLFCYKITSMEKENNYEAIHLFSRPPVCGLLIQYP